MAKRDEVLGLRLNAAELDALKALAEREARPRVVAALSSEARGGAVGCPHPAAQGAGGVTWTIGLTRMPAPSLAAEDGHRDGGQRRRAAFAICATGYTERGRLVKSCRATSGQSRGARVFGDGLRKPVDGSKHFLRQPAGICFDDVILDQAERAGAVRVEVKTRVGHHLHGATCRLLAAWRQARPGSGRRSACRSVFGWHGGRALPCNLGFSERERRRWIRSRAGG